MYRWLVVWYLLLNIASGMLDVHLLNSRLTGSQYECFDYGTALPLRSYDTGWQFHKKLAKMLDMTTPKFWPGTTQGFNGFSRRIDSLWNRDDIVKEHAKLVQDINGLRQVMYVAPLTEEKDYDYSIFPELIETSSTTTVRPTTSKSVKSTRTGIPIIVLGGGSRKHATKSDMLKIPKKTISLVGTASPIVRHPYPFVTAASSNQPVTICMASPIRYSTTTRRPSLWERLVRAIIPR